MTISISRKKCNSQKFATSTQVASPKILKDKNSKWNHRFNNPKHAILGVLAAWGAFVDPARVGAIESSSMLDRYSVVGVIAGVQNTNNIAVIRDIISNKSLTLRIGAKIGVNNTFKVISIARKKVIVERSGKHFSLQYGIPNLNGNATSPKKKHNTRINNYLSQDTTSFSIPVYRGYEEYQKWAVEGFGDEYDTANRNTYQLIQRSRSPQLPTILPIEANSDSVFEDQIYIDETQQEQEEIEFRRHYLSRDNINVNVKIKDEATSAEDPNPLQDVFEVNEQYDDGERQQKYDYAIPL